jgi:hypothetical protein
MQGLSNVHVRTQWEIRKRILIENWISCKFNLRFVNLWLWKINFSCLSQPVSDNCCDSLSGLIQHDKSIYLVHPRLYRKWSSQVYDTSLWPAKCKFFSTHQIIWKLMLYLDMRLYISPLSTYLKVTSLKSSWDNPQSCVQQWPVKQVRVEWETAVDSREKRS